MTFRKIMIAMTNAMRKMMIIATRMRMAVGDSEMENWSELTGALLVSVVTFRTSIRSVVLPSSMYVFFCVELLFGALTAAIFVDGKKNPFPSGLIGVGSDPNSGSLGNECFGGTKLSFLVLPLMPVMETLT